MHWKTNNVIYSIVLLQRTQSTISLEYIYISKLLLTIVLYAIVDYIFQMVYPQWLDLFKKKYLV